MKDFKKMTREEIQAIVDREKSKRSPKVLVSGKTPEPKGTETEEVYKLLGRSFLDSVNLEFGINTGINMDFNKRRSVYYRGMIHFDKAIEKQQKGIQKAEQFFEIEEGMKRNNFSTRSSAGRASDF